MRRTSKQQGKVFPRARPAARSKWREQRLVGIFASALGHINPMQFENNWLAAQLKQAA